MEYKYFAVGSVYTAKDCRFIGFGNAMIYMPNPIKTNADVQIAQKKLEEEWDYSENVIVIMTSFQFIETLEEKKSSRFDNVLNKSESSDVKDSGIPKDPSTTGDH